MSYVRTETSVRTHPKFMAAGPAASWLWLCGNAYCQDGLTDGFIPDAALEFLGVPKPRPLAATLVRVRLWEQVDGGWQVHDYLKHNNSAEHVEKVRTERRRAGRSGGRPQKQVALTNMKQFALTLFGRSVKQRVNPSTATATATQTATSTSVPEEHEKQEPASGPCLPVENRDDVRAHRRRRSRETDDGRPATKVISALARQILAEHFGETDEGELREQLKLACVKANLFYDGGAISAALDQAQAQQKRRAS